jgi:hypothetical protein
MKKLTIGLVVAAVLVLIVGTAAFAQAETPEPPEGWEGFGGRGPGGKGGRGMMGPGDGTGEMHDLMIESMAAALGISVDELEAQREAGVPLSEVAAALGLSQDEFFEAMSAARDDVMEQAYADGLLTDEQYEFFQNRGEGIGQFGGGMGHHGGGWGGRGGGGFNSGCHFYGDDN